MLTESLVPVSADPRVELLVAQSPGPAGRALLVIHGGPDWDHTYLRDPLSELAGQYRLVLPDLRGCGRSTRGLPSGCYTPDAAAADLLALLDRLGLADVDLLGFSYGGLLAQRLAVTAPSRVRRLIIASSSIGPVPDGAFAGWAERDRRVAAEAAVWAASGLTGPALARAAAVAGAPANVCRAGKLPGYLDRLSDVNFSGDWMAPWRAGTLPPAHVPAAAQRPATAGCSCARPRASRWATRSPQGSAGRGSPPRPPARFWPGPSSGTWASTRASARPTPRPSGCSRRSACGSPPATPTKTGSGTCTAVVQGDPEPVLAVGLAVGYTAVGQDHLAGPDVAGVAGDQDPAQPEAAALVQRGGQHRSGVALPPPGRGDAVADVAAGPGQRRGQLVPDDQFAQVMLAGHVPVDRGGHRPHDQRALPLGHQPGEVGQATVEQDGGRAGLRDERPFRGQPGLPHRGGRWLEPGRFGELHHPPSCHQCDHELDSTETVYIHLSPVRPVETPCVCTTLRMATRSVVRLYDHALGGAGLRQAAYSILSRVDAEGPLTISELADRLVLERTTCSREVEALRKTGLLVIEAGRDRRQRVMRLSPEGAARLAGAREHWQAVQQRLRDSCGAQGTDDLLDQLRALLHASEGLIGH